MNDHDALLAAVLVHPEEDTPRLVFADWLEENARAEWAEFVRVEVELAKLGVDPDRHAHLTARCRTLWPHLGVRLPAPGGRWLTPELAQFARGFVEHVTYTAADWLAVADSLHWHPGQATECPVCKGHGWTTEPAGCPACRPKVGVRGLGTVPRPCPATSQPVRKVTLVDGSDAPARFYLDNGFVAAISHGELVWVSPKWPGVEFGWPSTVFAIPRELTPEIERLIANATPAVG